MKQEINILQITVRADIGGGPEHLFRLVKGLSPDINCVIAAPNDEPYYKLFSEHVGEANVIEIPHRKFKLSILWLLQKEIKRRNISIIHSHGKGAGIYSRLLGFISRKRVIHTLHGFHVGEYNSVQKNLYILLERFLALFTHKFITVSEGEKRKILNADICKEEKIIVIPNGVEIPQIGVPQSNFEQDTKKFITFSRFNFQKNTELLIKICKKLRDDSKLDNIEFDIYGDGEDFKRIEREVKLNKLEKAIILHGIDADARDKLVDGFCYISTSRWEGLPLSLLEAMAVGLPIIATDVVGNNDVVIDNNNGLLFDLENADSGKDKILQLISDRELWIELSSRSKKTVLDKFSIEKMIQETEKVYLS